MKRIIFLLIIFILASCRSLDERNEECIENMPVEVQGYVREFLHEGEKRGKKIKLKKLRIFLTGDLNNRAGFYNTADHIIFIDTTSVDWNLQANNYPLLSTNIGRRVVLFHELGHAVLKRDHTEEMSIMSYNFEIYSHNQTELIDELFK